MTYRREWSRSCLRILRIGLALGLLGAAPAAAQLLYGGLVGSVIDAQGAVVPGARVTIVNTDTNFTRETTTDAQGAYSFANIQAGPYVVKVALQGFREAVRSAVPVRVGQISRVDLTLQVGAMSETITVQSAAELLQTDKADVHTELRSTEITNLPLNRFRNYQGLVVLVPGSLPPAFQNAETDTPQRSLNMTVNGQDGAANTTLTDGTRNVNVGLPHHNVYIAPAETIESVNITTSSMDAEEGMAAGVAITVITKSGTNTLQRVAVRVLQQREAECVAVLLRADTDAETPDRAADVRRDARRSDPAQSIVLFRIVRGLHRPAGAVRLLQRAERGDSQRRLQRRAQRERNTAADLRPVVWRPRHRHGPRAVRQQHHSGRPHQRDLETAFGPLSAAERRGHRGRRLHEQLPDGAPRQHRSTQLRRQGQLEPDVGASALGQIQPHERSGRRPVQLPARQL